MSEERGCGLEIRIDSCAFPALVIIWGGLPAESTLCNDVQVTNCVTKLCIMEVERGGIVGLWGSDMNMCVTCFRNCLIGGTQTVGRSASLVNSDLDLLHEELCLSGAGVRALRAVGPEGNKHVFPFIEGNCSDVKCPSELRESCCGRKRLNGTGIMTKRSSSYVVVHWLS